MPSKDTCLQDQGIFLQAMDLENGPFSTFYMNAPGPSSKLSIYTSSLGSLDVVLFPK